MIFLLYNKLKIFFSLKRNNISCWKKIWIHQANRSWSIWSCLFSTAKGK